MANQCAVCGEDRPLMRYMAQQMCGKCMQTEINNQKEIDNTAETRIEAMHVDMLSRQVEVDQSIEVETDLFNANTVSIVEMKKAIDEDDSIPNKHYELAERLVARHDHFKEKLFQINKAQASVSNAQRAIQTYLNELSHTLRDDQRKALNLQHIGYNPKPIKKPTKARQPKKKSYNKDQLSAAVDKASELGLENVFASTIQTLAISQNLEPLAVVNFLVNLKKKAATNVQAD